jgi:poly(A) polymerase
MMAEPDELRIKPPCRREDAQAVLRCLREAGHVAYFAGGCVRDLLLGLEPKDWDVATDAPPERVRELFRNTQAVGQAFGVILVRQGRSIVEVATFRAEGRYLDGRRPSEVRFTTAQEDARRRDFTINGLFLDPLEDDRIIDYVGGREDLADRRLRAIGRPEERFAEDHLRLLRAVRFAARFGLEIEPATAAAIERDGPLLRHISPERIADELRLMLTAPTRSAAWLLLWRFGLVGVIYRFLPVKAGVRLEPKRSLFLSLAPGAAISSGLALAGAGLDVRWQQSGFDPAQVRQWLWRPEVQKLVKAMRQGLKISNEETDDLAGTLEGLEPLLADAQPRVAQLKRFLARPTSGGSRKLLDALDAVGLFSARIGWLRGRLAELEQEDVAPPPLINGDDLTAAGLTPGPEYKRVLDAVYDGQLEGRVMTKDEALAAALEISQDSRGGGSVEVP